MIISGLSEEITSPPLIDEFIVGVPTQQDLGNNLSSATSIFGEQARLSYFGRTAYNFQEKYLAEFLWRYDGSYIFPEVGRFGFFPGVLVGWNVAKEKFFDDIKFLSACKVIFKPSIHGLRISTCPFV